MAGFPRVQTTWVFDMTDLPKLVVEQDGEKRMFGGSWWRGGEPNFIPSREALRQPGALERHVLAGWIPDAPFITKTDKVTAFGSCFAKHITDYLSARGYALMGKDLGLQSHIIRFGEGMVNTFAILQQLEWAIENKQMPEDLWYSPDKECVSVDPAIRDETLRIVNETDVFIITLGLTEIWYNKINGEALWRAVPAQYFDENIHGFRVSTYQENYDNLRRIRELIRAKRPDAPLIFTLSPVPLMATFRPVSCITASSVSKATLRVAVDQLMRDCGDDANLYYFPSYEIVKEFFVDAYKEDNRHPKDEIVIAIMQAFERHYCIP